MRVKDLVRTLALTLHLCIQVVPVGGVKSRRRNSGTYVDNGAVQIELWIPTICFSCRIGRRILWLHEPYPPPADSSNAT